MYDVYRSLSKISTKDLEDYTLEEVAWMFQQTDNKAFRNKCYVYVFKKLFPMLLKIHHKQKFITLPYEDRTEECMLKVFLAMEKWNENKKVKLITYIHTAVNNALSTLVTLSQNGKHNVFNNLVTVDDEIKKYIMDSIPYKDNTNSDLTDFINDATIFSKDESLLCTKMLEGYRTTKELASQLNKKSLTTYSKKHKKCVTTPMTTDNLIKYCGKLKSSIKKKLGTFRHK